MLVTSILSDEFVDQFGHGNYARGAAPLGSLGSRTRGVKSTPAGREFAGAREVFRRVHSERHALDHRDIDAHAGLERAKLLELLPPFEDRRRQCDEALERAAAVS